jgi:putative ABC transport system permease protein
VFHTSREAERLADSALPVRALEVLAKGTTDTAALRRQAEKAVTDLYGDDAGFSWLPPAPGRRTQSSGTRALPGVGALLPRGTFGVLPLFVAGLSSPAR